MRHSIASWIKKTALKFNKDLTWALQSHTAIPEGYLTRRVLVAFCDTQEGLDKAIEVSSLSQVMPVIVVLLKEPQGGGYQTAVSPFAGFPARFRSEVVALKYVTSEAFKKVDELFGLYIEAQMEDKLTEFPGAMLSFAKSNDKDTAYQVNQASAVDFGRPKIARVVMVRESAIDDVAERGLIRYQTPRRRSHLATVA